MNNNELISVEVVILVLQHFGYEFQESFSTEIALVFVGFKEPFRKNVPQITLDAPDLKTEDGKAAYREAKLLDVISFVHGLASLGEAIHIIKVTRERLH